MKWVKKNDKVTGPSGSSQSGVRQGWVLSGALGFLSQLGLIDGFYHYQLIIVNM